MTTSSNLVAAPGIGDRQPEEEDREREKDEVHHFSSGSESEHPPSSPPAAVEVGDESREPAPGEEKRRQEGAGLGGEHDGAGRPQGGVEDDAEENHTDGSRLAPE